MLLEMIEQQQQQQQHQHEQSSGGADVVGQLLQQIQQVHGMAAAHLLRIVYYDLLLVKRWAHVTVHVNAPADSLSPSAPSDSMTLYHATGCALDGCRPFISGRAFEFEHIEQIVYATSSFDSLSFARY
jgi:hypothetical protein